MALRSKLSMDKVDCSISAFSHFASAIFAHLICTTTAISLHHAFAHDLTSIQCFVTYRTDL